MANELNIALAKSGLTVTAQRYQSGAAVGSAIALSEVGSSGFYSGNMTGTAGTYQLAFISAGANVGSGSIVWSGTAEVPVSTLTTGDLPSVPSVTDIRTEMDSNSSKLANLDATISSRLADADYTAPTSAPTVSDIRTELAVELGRLDASVSSRLAGSSYTAPTTPPTAAEIATAVEGSLLNEADGQAVINAIVGAIGNTNLSEVSIVAAIRSDLERTGGKLDSIPTTSAPSASTVAGAVRTELGTELSRIDQSISSRLASADYTAPTAAPTAAQNASAVRSELSTELARIDAPISGATAPSAATVASAVRTELSTELGRVDAAVSTRATPANVPTSDITAIKTRLDSINVERVNNTATTNIVGTLLAQSQS